MRPHPPLNIIFNFKCKPLDGSAQGQRRAYDLPSQCPPPLPPSFVLPYTLLITVYYYLTAPFLIWNAPTEDGSNRSLHPPSLSLALPLPYIFLRRFLGVIVFIPLSDGALCLGLGFSPLNPRPSVLLLLPLFSSYNNDILRLCLPLLLDRILLSLCHTLTHR